MSNFTICVAKTKVLISCAVTAQLICTFVFASGKFLFSHDAAQMTLYCCQVWSSDAGQTHSPPSDLVMKGQSWFVADQMKTVLLKDDAVGTETMPI